MAVAQRFAWLIAAIAVCSQSIFASSLPSPSDFLVHSISVNHELGGALHGSSQLHLIEQPASAAVTKYFIGLSALEAASLSSNEVNLKFGPGMLPEQRSAAYLKSEGSIETTHGAGESDVTHLYSVEIPEGFFKRPENTNVVVPNITISVDMIFHRLSEPLPKTVAQRAGVSLVWEGDSVPRTPYGARRVRVKAKAPTPKTHSYSLIPSFPDDSEILTKSGSTITIGPQSNVRPVGEHPIQKARIHYAYDQPIVGLVELNRHVEVSHWGNNLAFQDKVWLKNNGPALKGHFSRVEHQLSNFHGGAGRNLLTDVAVLLPPGAKDAYFIDQIGNVSTSHFRSAPADSELIDVPSHEIPDHKASLLHLQPRYPILGGWNYTYTVGWNLPLSDGWLTILPSTFPQEYSVAVPFWNAMRNVPAGIVRTEIVLPEGAEIVSVETPFETEEIRYTTYTTYLDTIGRPAVVITKERATEREGANVYVTYRMDTSAHLMKPMAVASVFFAMFAGALVLRRLQSRK